MAPNAAVRVTAKGLGIKLGEEEAADARLRPGSGIEPYYEEKTTTTQFLYDHSPSIHGVQTYFRNLFPFWGWIFHYNLTWLLGDIIAGVTVGFVVVPQGMAYAVLANLPPEYGLYTSFVGFLLYWAFATSKDITIGAVAVMSTLTGNIIIRVTADHPEFSGPQIATSLALIAGSVLLFIGLIRFGFIVEFIPLIGISSFMTGAAITIGVGQVPTMMGIAFTPPATTRDACYLVIINTLKGLPNTKIDAAMGLSALAFLYFVRWICGFLAKRFPKQQKIWFFVSTLRMAFVILLYILISWLVNRNISDSKKAIFKILGTVPSGFQHTGAPLITTPLLQVLAPDIPTTIIVLIIEHIAISKSFGRINNYIIDPSQELVAIGFSNVLGPFLGGYPATGSFSRTAIKAKAGVRTPLAGLFTAVIVLLALYALTAVFYYIPSATLSALIIHAVGDLITPPSQVYQYWKQSPLEVISFFAGIILTVFTSLENGIYLNVCFAAALLLYRIARTTGKFLGRTRVLTASPSQGRAPGSSKNGVKDVFVALDNSDGSNPSVLIDQPYPGVFVYKFPDGFNYLNSAHHLDVLTIHIFGVTRRTQLDSYAKIGDRPWNDPGPRRGQHATEDIASRPLLRAVVLDFSSVNFVDVTAVQALIDLRYQFGRYAAPETVGWYFAHVGNAWTKRALVSAGFGVAPSADWDEELVSLAALGRDVPKSDASGSISDRSRKAGGGDDVEGSGGGEIGPVSRATGVDRQTPEELSGPLAPVYGLNRPFFFVDILTAVESAIIHAKRAAPLDK